MKKALLLCLGMTILFFGMDDPKIIKKGKASQVEKLDKQLMKINQQYKKAKRKKQNKAEQGFLYGQLLVTSNNLANEFLKLADQGDRPALQKVYKCEEIAKQVTRWAQDKKIPTKSDDYKFSCKICDIIILNLQKDLGDNDTFNEENKKTIFRNLDQLIIRTKSLFSLSDNTEITAKKIKSLNLAKNNYEEIQRLFDLLYNKTNDKRAQEGAVAIAVMLEKIEQRTNRSMGSIIVELHKE